MIPLKVLKPCINGIVLSTEIFMVVFNRVTLGRSLKFNLPHFPITVILISAAALCRAIFKKKLSTILLILIAGILGIILL